MYNYLPFMHKFESTPEAAGLKITSKPAACQPTKPSEMVKFIYLRRDGVKVIHKENGVC